MRLIKQSDTSRAIVFLMVDSSDHVTGKTGLSPTVTISKNGGSFASPSGTVSEIDNGWYKFTPAAADVDTLGPLIIHATASGADPLDMEYQVVAFDPYAAANLGLTYLDATISSRAPANTALSNTVWTDAKAAFLDAAISSRLAASSYVAPDNASISAIKTQTDKFQFDSNNYVYAVGVGGGGGTDWTDDEKKQIRYRLGIDGTTASPQSNTPHLGSTYSTLDDLAAHVSTRLAASAYTAPDNDGISAIKKKTDRLRFDANSNVYATGLGGGGGSVQVIVQPLPVYPIDFAPDGGVVEAFTFARIRKSWLVTKTNLEGHDLRFIVFSQANPLEALAECSGDEIAITLQGEDSLVALDAAEREIQPGLYGWVLRDQTADTVLLRGKFLMKPAPDAG